LIRYGGGGVAHSGRDAISEYARILGFKNAVIAGVLIAGDRGLSPVDETRFPTDIAGSWCPRRVVRAIQIRLPSPVEGPPGPPGRRKDRIYAELHRNRYAVG
jgi:hypothetical protein